MQFNTYTSAGALIAAELASHPAADAATIGSLLARHQVHQPLPTAGQLTELRRWAGDLRGVFQAGGAREQAECVDALLTASQCRPRLVSHDGLPYHLHYASVASDLVSRVRALTAAGLAHVIDEGEGTRLRCCQRTGCPIAFVDTSRNGRRRFCTLRCANQVNVARHRARQRGQIRRADLTGRGPRWLPAAGAETTGSGGD